MPLAVEASVLAKMASITLKRKIILGQPYHGFSAPLKKAWQLEVQKKRHVSGKRSVKQSRSADQNLAPAGMKGCEVQAFVLHCMELGSSEFGFLALNHSVRNL